MWHNAQQAAGPAATVPRLEKGGDKVAGKLNLAVSALRWGEDIHATVQAMLPDGQHRAEVTDIYPGGSIVYANDPGEAQIFVKVSRTGAGESAAAA